jgi:hypothetical protein
MFSAVDMRQGVPTGGCDNTRSRQSASATAPNNLYYSIQSAGSTGLQCVSLDILRLCLMTRACSHMSLLAKYCGQRRWR